MLGESMKRTDNILRLLSNPAVFQQPDRLQSPPAWVTHIPFAFWTVAVLRPRVLVELGTHSGNSYCAFCQAVQSLKLNTTCYAVDTWKGDPHSGFYGEEAYQEISEYHDSRYTAFSRLIRSTFDEAVNHFADGSIDLLHIDGFHTYDAVKHDFETWLPKLSARSVVLIHDTNVHELDFGVWVFWEELKTRFATFSFFHGHGLGVVAVGLDVPKAIRGLVDPILLDKDVYEVRGFFSRLGNPILERFDSQRWEKECGRIAKDADTFRREMEQRNENVQELTRHLDAAHRQLSAMSLEIEQERAAWTTQRADWEEQRVFWEQERAAWEQERTSREQERISWEQERAAWEIKKAAWEQERAEMSQEKIREVQEAKQELEKLAARHAIEVEQQERTIAEQNRNLRAASNQYRHIERELQKRNLQFELVCSSRSWRITAPLRQVAKVFHARGFRIFRRTFKMLSWCLTFQLRKQLQLRKVAKEIDHAGLFDAAWYREQYPEIDLLNVDPLLHFVAQGAAEQRNPHPLFDTNFYLEKNPDLTTSGRNPLLHFAFPGAKEGRNPHPLFDIKYYTFQNPELSESGINPLIHFIHSGAQERRNPHPLFDMRYYLQTNPEVSQDGQNPLLHFLCRGALERRNPHPLFDCDFYLTQYPDAAAGNMNPLVYFLLKGWKKFHNPNPLFDTRFYIEHSSVFFRDGEDPLSHFIREGAISGRYPNPFFDCSYYLERYWDVRAAGLNPLEHFLAIGAKELRDPSPRFCSEHYLSQYPDVAKSGMNPLAHFLLFGIKEGRNPVAARRVRVPLEKEERNQLLPVSIRSVKQPSVANSPVSVIIPVFRGYLSTRSCIESVLKANNASPYQLVIINDCTPDQHIAEYLKALEDIPSVRVIYNSRNLGFVGSVNKGMSIHPGSDVVLLNSDTIVPHFWVDRLAAHAYWEERIGTVTPFSNNGTICSYPTIRGFAHFPPDESLATFDQAFREANQGRSVEIPTAVGFCMYIRRFCLDQVGLFDETTFGKGYGEENDFCLRATKQGWKHLLAADVFVYHEGEVSFGKKSSARASAQKIIRERYPDYEANIARYIEKNPAEPYRIAATATRLRLSSKPVVLIVTHILGGGTERHVQDLIQSSGDKVRFVVLRPPTVAELSADFTLEIQGENEKLHFVISQELCLDFLAALLKSCGVDRVHLHHSLGMPLPMMPLIRSLQIPFDITVHDYFAICPQVTLTCADGEYCGEPDFLSCTECIMQRPSWGAFDILWWRLLSKPLFTEADRILCPSFDVICRMKRYFPDGKYLLVPHTTSPQAHQDVYIPPLATDEPLRVAILGVLSPQKGSSVVLETARLLAGDRPTLKLFLIGRFFDNSDSNRTENLPGSISVTGPYQEEGLSELIDEIDPHIIWFPARGPETFSYTLSAALRSSRPIVAPKLGAFVERLEGRPWTWSVHWNIRPSSMIELFEQIRKQMLDRSNNSLPPETSVLKHITVQDERDFYPHKYLLPLEKYKAKGVSKSKDIDDRLSILLLVETLQDGRHPSPCSYIRILLPLTHPELRHELDLTVVSYDEVFLCTADVLIVNRIAVARSENASRLIAYCRTQGIKIVYDLDDDVFSLADHTERTSYESSLPAVSRLLESADLVWVSSEVLSQRLIDLNSCCEVVPNALEERLWLEAAHPVTPRLQTDIVRIVYMGTVTHAQDFRLIEEPLQRLSDEFGANIEIELIGVLSSNEELPSCCKIRAIPTDVASSYPAFVRWIQSQKPWDIGLAPLIDSPFNRAKSEIKFLDYTAMGAVPVCSDLPPYRKIGRHEDNCMLVSNKKETWFTALRRLILDRDLREKLHKSAMETLLSQYTLQTMAWRRRDSLRKLVEVKKDVAENVGW